MPMTNGKSASAVQVRILGDASAFGEALRSDLKAAHSMSVAVAFAKESALEVLDVEDWCRSGRSLKFLAGTDFALTELDLLKRLSNAPTAECKIYHSLGKNRVFHPKLYVLEKAESKVVYVGSSNFTRGGLRTNIEANVRLEGPAEASEVDDATRLYGSLFGGEYATPVDPEFERSYKELQRKLRSVQEYPTVAGYAQDMQFEESLLLGKYRSSVSNKRWLLVTSPENFATCLRVGVWGRQRESEIAAYTRGDVFFFHLTQRSGIVAFGMFVGDPYHDESPLWSPSPRGVFPWRIRLHIFAILTGAVPTKDVLISLRPGAPSHWFNGFIQKSRALEQKDFEALKRMFEAMARAERPGEMDA